MKVKNLYHIDCIFSFGNTIPAQPITGRQEDEMGIIWRC
jgi:hypothetical protein